MAPKSVAVPLLSTNVVAQKDARIKELERKNNFLRHENDTHLKTQFELENRIRTLTHQLGFQSLADAESQLGTRDVSVFELESALAARTTEVQHLSEDLLVADRERSELRRELVGARRRVEEVERECREASWAGRESVGNAERELAELRLEMCEKDALIARLQAPRIALSQPGKENSQSSNVPSSSPLNAPHLSTPTKSRNTAAFLQSLLSDLQERYDSLLRVYRENVEQRRREHVNWKEFKAEYIASKERKEERKRKRVESKDDTPGKRRRVALPTPATAPAARHTSQREASSPTNHILSQSRAPPADPSSSAVPTTPQPEVASQTQLEEEIEIPPRPTSTGPGAGIQSTTRVLVPASSDGPEHTSSPLPIAQSRTYTSTGQVFPPPPPQQHAPASTSRPPNPSTAPPAPLVRQWSTVRQASPPQQNTTPRPADTNNKGKGRAPPNTNASTSTPVLPADRDERLRYLKKLNDLPHREYVDGYKAFKGHGRYARETEEEGVNAKYEIDRTRNGGMDSRYDEVVRGREARRRLHGGDCECCRDYYAAVGPLPPRLEAPLWKSPSPPSHRRHTRSSSPSPRRAAEAHKQEVSRHRQVWAGGHTPPDYWHIGFPDTQQVEDINRRAREMHREKEKEIEREAKKKDGRYRRRE